MLTVAPFFGRKSTENAHRLVCIGHVSEVLVDNVCVWKVYAHLHTIMTHFCRCVWPVCAGFAASVARAIGTAKSQETALLADTAQSQAGENAHFIAGESAESKPP